MDSFQQTYANLSDDQLIGLAKERDTLQTEAQAALDAEIAKRGLLARKPKELPPEESTPSPLPASRRKESVKMSTLQATQTILLIEWVIVPALGIWIWVKTGFLRALLFVIIWLIVDKVWDWLTGLLIAGAGRIEEGKVSEPEVFERVISGDVPGRMAFMMIVDLLGTLLIPWIVGGFFLGWFQ